MGKKEVYAENIPVISVCGKNIPDAWEKAVLRVWQDGVEIRTEYDSSDDPPSLDATAVIEIQEPIAEPRIHKNFPGGPQELEIYRQEVMMGIHDHWINPSAGKWTYTYHQRLFAYRPVRDVKNLEEDNGLEPVDQIEKMIEKLCKTPYSRRAQAITWIPTADPDTDDPPCLQRLWARLLPSEGEKYRLNLNAHWRSRDLYKAWFMNVYALTELQKWMAQRIAEQMGTSVECGRYVDITDSLHIYGSYMDEKFENEIEKMQSSPFTDRAWDSSVMEPIFEEVRERLKEDPDFYAKGN
jgi:thymidylate synthase